MPDLEGDEEKEKRLVRPTEETVLSFHTEVT